ncbi:MAG: SEC-C domain-containing protein [Chloroflexi bacterium]|nr:SEC-C domain-containing protein [Chloroflexota bacterium]
MTGTGDLNRSLGQLCQAGQHPDQSLLERIKAHGEAAVHPLIQLAVDEKLHGADSSNPEVWAPLHAIQILGELGSVEAIEPLLPLFDRVNDDSLAQMIPQAFGGIGAPAVAPLRTLLFDRARDIWARVRAAQSLGEIGRRQPETRSEVTSTLVARLDPAESRVPDDECLNGFVVCELLDLQAVEAAPAIRRAFDEDRVDTSIVDLDRALEELGLASESRPARSGARQGLRLRLRCTACGYTREHSIETIYCDLATQGRRQRGEQTPFDEWVIPQRITCQKCGAVDQYELSSLAYITLTAELVKKLAARAAGQPGGASDEGALQFIRFGLADGREMHPYEARALYRQRVEAEPDRADLQVRYANVLQFLGDREGATEHYQAALRLEPANLEAFFNLGRLARATGDRVEARRMFESLLAQAPKSRLPRNTREDYVEAAAEELDELVEPFERSGIGRLPTERHHDHGLVGGRSRAAAPRGPARAVQKIGRNEPCPCGSGQKYKRCHGR